MTNVHSLKILDFNRMLAFYMHGYNKVCKSKCCKVGGVKKKSAASSITAKVCASASAQV